MIWTRASARLRELIAERHVAASRCRQHRRETENREPVFIDFAVGRGTLRCHRWETLRDVSLLGIEGVVARFKFTARPVKPNWVQRELRLTGQEHSRAIPLADILYSEPSHPGVVRGFKSSILKSDRASECPLSASRVVIGGAFRFERKPYAVQAKKVESNLVRTLLP